MLAGPNADRSLLPRVVPPRNRRLFCLLNAVAAKELRFLAFTGIAARELCVTLWFAPLDSSVTAHRR
jgi:hypothetical protein